MDLKQALTELEDSGAIEWHHEQDGSGAIIRINFGTFWLGLLFTPDGELTDVEHVR